MLAGPLFALAVVVAAAGVLKLSRPSGAATALRAARLPSGEGPVRLLGLAEIVLAAAVLAFGGSLTSLLLGAAYAGFAGFAAVLMTRSGRAASCGCFGEASTAPTTPVHVGINLAAAVVAFAGVAWPTDGLVAVVREQPAAGLPFLLLVGVGAWMVVAALTSVPELLAAMAEVRADSAADAGEGGDHHRERQRVGPVSVALGATRR